MDPIRKMTFSKKFSAILFLISLALLMDYLMPCVSFAKLNLSIFIFAVGALAAYPLINKAWIDVEEKWDEEIEDTGKSYEDFFSKDLDEDVRSKIVKHHWSSIAWTVPYAFTVYLYLAFFVIYFIYPFALFVFFAGSIFMISVESLRFQRQLNFK